MGLKQNVLLIFRMYLEVMKRKQILSQFLKDGL